MLVRRDGRFFVRFSDSGRCVSAWSLCAAKLFPLWDLSLLEIVQDRLGSAASRWRVMRVSLCRGEIVMRVARVDGRLSLVAVPFE